MFYLIESKYIILDKKMEYVTCLSQDGKIWTCYPDDYPGCIVEADTIEEGLEKIEKFLPEFKEILNELD